MSMDFIFLAMGLIVGAFLGGLFVRVAYNGKLREAEARGAAAGSVGHEALIKSEAQAVERARSLTDERDRVVVTSERLQAAMSELTGKASSLDSEKRLIEQQLQTQREYIEELRKQTRVEFENLANRVLEAKSKSFTEQTERNLEGLLRPLKDKIGTFEKSVEEKYSNEAKERHALKSEIERLVGLGDRMSLETQQLAQALKGDSKVVGDWGELVLERILEASGLRAGHEYSTQESLTSDEGDRFRPDIIINLPEGKHLIVDSKVSLKAYEIYRNAGDDATRTQALAAHLKSVDKHISDLGDKHYARLKGVRSPEFVFLFVPIEPAYLLAMQSDPELSTRAWNKNVAFVTTTTLLTSLRTVASTWRLENQNRNAAAIAAESSKLYDKFVGFLEDFEKIGHAFDSGKRQYDSALGKLRDGPGNVFRKMEQLRELGAAPSKRIKQELLE